MVKSYSKYGLTQTFGLVVSSLSNVTSFRAATKADAAPLSPGKAVVGANEDVLVWDVKTAELVGRWKDAGCTAQVTCIRQSHSDLDMFAVGYEDGKIRLWDSRIEAVVVSLHAHRSAVVALAFDPSGVKLASGAQDTHVIIWDLVTEAGLVRLRGHKDQVVSLAWIYPLNDNSADNALLLSASKDATVKVWNTVTQHCVETHIAQTNGECWSLAVTPDMSGCITAGNDGELRVWSIDSEAMRVTDYSKRILCSRGVLYRDAKDKTTGLVWHPSQDFFAVSSSQKAVEIWRIRTEVEVQKLMQRKKRRKREKENKDHQNDTDNKENESQAINQTKDDQSLTPTINDFFIQHVVVRANSKVSSVDWVPTKSKKLLQILVSTTNNTLQVFDIAAQLGEKEAGEDTLYSKTHSIEYPGHRTDVRAVAISSDDRLLATASNGLLKIWNAKTGACLRTLECGYALTCCFLSGDKIVVVGTKSGHLELYDIASSTLIHTVEAHQNGSAIWALQVHPDGRSCISGASDKQVKFWDFKIFKEDVPGTTKTLSRLNLVHSRTLKLNDDVLSLCYTPDAKLIAVSTLDNTVKVFFNDSLKLFLNLYGHKLPVISMSISSDSKLIATSSADKNIRLWGLDFGDCHKALFGHQDSIMGVRFIPEPENPQDAHFLFSISKDKTIKTWDGDKFEQVQKLPGHHSEIWAMAVSRSGEFFVTTSHDKSVRVWSLVDDLIFLEEEREKELEELYDATLNTSLDADAEALEASRGSADAATASKQTPASLTSAEKIQEALELGVADLGIMRDWNLRKANNPKVAPPKRDALFTALGGISAETHMLNAVAALPAQQLTDALLILPFSTLHPLFVFVRLWLRARTNVPLACRILFFMVKLHQAQIVASQGGVNLAFGERVGDETSANMKLLLADIRSEIRQAVGDMREMMGVNGAALRSIAGRARDLGVVWLEDVEKVEAEELERENRKKRSFVDLA